MIVSGECFLAWAGQEVVSLGQGLEEGQKADVCCLTLVAHLAVIWPLPHG